MDHISTNEGLLKPVLKPSLVSPAQFPAYEAQKQNCKRTDTFLFQYFTRNFIHLLTSYCQLTKTNRTYYVTLKLQTMQKIRMTNLLDH